MVVFPQNYDYSTDLAILQSGSKFVPKYLLNWQLLVATLHEFSRHIDGTTEV